VDRPEKLLHVGHHVCDGRLFAVGFADDYLKADTEKKQGLRAWSKLTLQVLIAAIAAVDAVFLP
jgi:UDP-N-acetylmuramyl pentapeptide phosphotransferase/UDP-N-acetylglucosamine-1-phosphate transferase